MAECLILRPDPAKRVAVRLALLFFLLIAAGGCGIAQTESVADFKERFNKELAPRIETAIAKAVERELFSGCVLIAKGDDILFARSYGEANKDFHIRNTLHTRFNIASGTKPFTAVAVMLLAQKGLLSISDPVIRYLPDFPFGDKITLFHLLSHTSGLGHYTEEYMEKMHRVRGFDAFLKQFIYKEKPRFEPGTKYSYSNSGVVLLGAIIEKVSGLTYGDFMEQNIFAPLGMRETCSRMPEEVIENRASGYRRNPSGGFLETSLDVCPPTSATGLKTTAPDLFRFIRAVHQDRLLKAEYKKIMFTPYRNSDKGPYALLWDVLDGGLFVKSNNQVIGHRGGQAGFRSMHYYYLNDQITIITLCNLESDDSVYQSIETILFLRRP